MSPAWHPVEARTHEAVRRGEDGAQLVLAHVAERPPRGDAFGPKRLDLPDVPDTRDEALVEQGVADLAVRWRAAEALDHLVVVGRLREDVGAEAERDAAVELEDRPVPENAGMLLASQDEPRPAEERRVPSEHTPPPFHAQVTAQHEPALESQQQVLPDRLDALEPLAVQPRRELLHGGTRMRRLDLQLLADEDLQPPGGPVQRVAFGHAARVCAPHSQE